MPIKWDSKILLVKTEGAYGTDSAPTAAANAILAKNIELRPMEGQDVSRDLEQPYIGAQEELPVGLYSVISFEVEAVGSGTTGVAPAWSSLIRACGVAEVVTADVDPGDGTVEYSPVTDGHESASIYFWIGGTRHVLLGARGTVSLSVATQGIPMFKYTLTGLFTMPAETARVAPDLSNFAVPQVASNTNTPTFTIDGDEFVLRDFGFDLANDVQQRLLIGKEEILIVDRAETISAQVEAVPLGTFNPFQVALSAARMPVALTHGTQAGKKVSFAAPACTLKRPSGYQQNQKILEWPLALTPLPVDGDDQWTITLT